jgi:biofilm PGA synthesis N-glycosyltransferase PgaC
MGETADKPVFYDRRGRRWRYIRWFFVLLIIELGVGAYWIVPKMGQSENLHQLKPIVATRAVSPATDCRNRAPEKFAYQIDRNYVPVFGDGPLVRVDCIQHTPNGEFATPVYGQRTRKLAKRERVAIGGSQYAIEHYGKLHGKKMLLTFDDGPDPTWTPKILNVLSKNHVPASFFDIGEEAVKFPNLLKREAREGHTIGSHTFTHVDFDKVGIWRGKQEITQTQRVIRADTGHQTSFLRLPYIGDDPDSLRQNLQGLLRSQRHGYQMVDYFFDSEDWQFPLGHKQRLPNLHGQPMVVLMHDGGGNRSLTVSYLQRLIDYAKSKGYTFESLNQAYYQQPALFAPVNPSIEDHATMFLASAYLVWPHAAISRLFVVTMALLVFTLIFNAFFAMRYIRRSRFKTRPRDYQPSVSVIIPAYNEAAVLEKTVRSVMNSLYRNFEIIIIDDGSRDDTWQIASQLAEQQYPVRAIHKENSGKARTINRGIEAADGDILVSVDADTVLPPRTLDNLIRHFQDPDVGAVSGCVKTGNMTNMWSRWQELDFTNGIFLMRNAQACVNAVMIAPGACSAWRASAVKSLGGYSHATLAEDADLTLAMHKAGYRVIQDNQARAYCEVPLSLRMLLKQRFRWIFGNIQNYWKHRDMFFRPRYGWLGMVVLPMTMVNLLVPLLFVPLLVLVDIENLLAGNYLMLLVFFGLTALVQIANAGIGIIIAPEKPSLMRALPVTVFIYAPMRAYLLYKSVIFAIRGSRVGWRKVQRTGSVTYTSDAGAPNFSTQFAAPKSNPASQSPLYAPAKSSGK